MPLHEEILGADLVEHSLNGSYDKTTSEWRDREGHLIMVVKQYENEGSIELLNRLNAGSMSCTLCNQMNPGNSVRTRRSAFGFTRSEDSLSHASEASDLEADNVLRDSGGLVVEETTHTNASGNNGTRNNNVIKSTKKRGGVSFFRKLGKPFRNGSTGRSGKYTVNSGSSVVDSIPNGSIVMERVET